MCGAMDLFGGLRALHIRCNKAKCASPTQRPPSETIWFEHKPARVRLIQSNFRTHQRLGDWWKNLQRHWMLCLLASCNFNKDTGTITAALRALQTRPELRKAFFFARESCWGKTAYIDVKWLTLPHVLARQSCQFAPNERRNPHQTINLRDSWQAFQLTNTVRYDCIFKL